MAARHAIRGFAGRIVLIGSIRRGVNCKQPAEGFLRVKRDRYPLVKILCRLFAF